MSVCIIDFFEIVHINHQTTQNFSVSPRPGNLHIKALKQPVPIEKTCRLICMSQLLEFFVHLGQTKIVIPQTRVGICQFLPGKYIAECGGKVIRYKKSKVVLDFIESVWMD